jgi:ribulose-bisphosphate carboxylase large chain
MFEVKDRVIVDYLIAKSDLGRIKEQVKKEYGAVLKGNGNEVRVEYPVDNFSMSVGDLPQIMNLIGIKKTRILDITFPKKFKSGFSGPKFGLEGIRKLIGTTKSRRPHLGMRIDYKKRLSPEQIAEQVYLFGKNGINFFTDDRDLVNQGFCPLDERAALIAEKINEIKKERGKTVLYAINITTRSDKVLDVADDALDAGANMLMLDVGYGSFSGINAIASDASIKVPLHVQISDSIPPNVSEFVVTKLARLSGGDQVFVEPKKVYVNTLLEKWDGLKTSMPVVSGDLDLVKKLGMELGIKVEASVEKVRDLKEKVLRVRR